MRTNDNKMRAAIEILAGLTMRVISIFRRPRQSAAEYQRIAVSVSSVAVAAGVLVRWGHLVAWRPDDASSLIYRLEPSAPGAGEMFL